MKQISLAFPPVLDDNGKELTSPKGLIAHMLRFDQRFNSDGAGIRACLRIEDALKAAGDSLLLEHSDWEKIRDAVETPKPITPGVPPYPVMPGSRIAPYVIAIADAKDYKPEEAKTNGKSDVATA